MQTHKEQIDQAKLCDGDVKFESGRSTQWMLDSLERTKRITSNSRICSGKGY